MQNISPSEKRRIYAAIEKLKGRYTSVESRVGYRPTPHEFAETILGGPLDDWQREFLDDAMESPRVAIAACRQSGKSPVHYPGF